MSGDTPTSPTGIPTPPEEPKKSLWERVPRHLFHGRVRTTTVVLVLLFVAGMVLYGQRADHYQNIDEENRQTRLSQVQEQQAPRTTTPTSVTPTSEPEYTSTPESTTPSLTPETTGTPSTTDQQQPNGPAPDGRLSETPAPPSTSESTRGLLPGLELPTMSIAP